MQQARHIAVFAKVNGEWRFEGFQNDIEVLKLTEQLVIGENGKGSWWAITMPDASPVVDHQAGVAVVRLGAARTSAVTTTATGAAQ